MPGTLNSIAVSLALLMAAWRPAPAASFDTEMLKAHNQVRATIPVRPLAWSAKLAAAAQKWADHLLASGGFEHQRHPDTGENLFEAGGYVATPAQIVAAWASEAADYHYRTNTCSAKCGHYTQLVWASTREVGCAQAGDARRQVVVCEYNPPGNYLGERPW